ncbi:hypothetical protein [Sinisalibacter lacisalsi]|uniref:Uncharacterized protein n=1 Tax=Sinisalibacter lacisalsi TaxID=1526570 RepID=A0ABQ1QUH2_9RHOB|nr:hypothetical protein [Sinisalibacter lacisalsi]GGD42145.1 hypothetical protein GCM10011358_27540 [Sinisalibacter lacisalsi]
MRHSKKAKPPEIVELEHGRYMIKAGFLQNTIVARAFPKPPSKFRHLVAEASGKTTADAIERLIEKLEALRSERRVLRRADPALEPGVPTTEEYADALRSLSPGPKLLGVLHDHALSRRRGMQLADLAKAGDYSSVQDLLNAYEKLGADILKMIEPDEVLKSGLPVVMHLPEHDGLPSTDLAALQPELQDAILHLLGAERRTG